MPDGQRRQYRTKGGSGEERVSGMERNGIQVYLLQVEELFDRRAEHRAEETALEARQNPQPENLPEDLPGWDRLTDWQQARVSRCREHSGAAKLCLGAELLLQYGAHRAAGNLQWQKAHRAADNRQWQQAYRAVDNLQWQQMPRTAEGMLPDSPVCWQMLTGEQLLSGIPGPLPLEVTYGERGKPSIAHVPWHYNLSHSGAYAALALSGAPVGIDIQKKGAYSQAMVKRFFSPEETQAYEKLSQCAGLQAEEAADLFYTLWCRKEAYGKLKGTGLTEDVLKRNMLEDTEVRFQEYDEVTGYHICVCCEKG